jgi:hypothetical protein
MEEMGEDEMEELAGSAGDISEMTYSDEVSGVWSLDEGELADPATVGNIKGKRLAVENLDWDSISAVDLLVLFNSFCQ